MARLNPACTSLPRFGKRASGENDKVNTPSQMSKPVETLLWFLMGLLVTLTILGALYCFLKARKVASANKGLELDRFSLHQREKWNADLTNKWARAKQERLKREEAKEMEEAERVRKEKEQREWEKRELAEFFESDIEDFAKKDKEERMRKNYGESDIELNCVPAQKPEKRIREVQAGPYDSPHSLESRRERRERRLARKKDRQHEHRGRRTSRVTDAQHEQTQPSETASKRDGHVIAPPASRISEEGLKDVKL